MTETVTFNVPDKDWLDERLEATRYESADDFIMQILDESMVLADEIEETETDEQVSVELPDGYSEEVDSLMQWHTDKEIESLDQLLELIMVQLYVQERMQFGGV